MAAAAHLAAHKYVVNEVAEANRLAHMSEVDKIREARAKRRQLDRARSTDEVARINKRMNLDADEWPTPFKQYLYFANMCNDVAQSAAFGNYILLCIIVAGALVGIQTYSTFEHDPTIASIDTFILIMFTVEVALKILGEGMGPWNFFIGPEYAWNIFDFLIVLLSMPFIPFEGGQIKLLRLIRLMRLAKAFRKIPQLQMIMMGLVGGLKSIIYIVVLMLLVFYLYACAGIIFFKANDPFHFKSVEVSMLTLLGVATLDGWGEIMFINYFGCDVYNGGFYTDEKSEHDGKTGGIAWCGTPEAQPTVSAIYFISFIVIAAFCILSLFIGAVAMSMVESMQEMKVTSREAQDRKIAKHRETIVKGMENKELLDRKSMRRLRLIELAFQGEDVRVIETEKDVGHGDTGWSAQHRKFAYACQDLAENGIFGQFITLVIVLAGVTVGVSTDPKLGTLWKEELDIIDAIIQYVFLTEIIIKVIAEEKKPWRYFYDPWNCFDFVVVAGSFMPSGGSLVTILRLLRLLRVLKLLRALMQLQVIVAALLKGLSAIAFISVILGMFFYFFSIIAMTFLGDNDQWHFGSLHMSMLALFQCATMDNWSAVMWISLYGCDVQDGDHPELCQNPGGQFMIATFFFMIIILVGALVLLTLFIGVVGMSMEEASQEQKKEKEIEDRALVIGEVENLDGESVRLFKEVFDSLDLIQCTRVGSEEMKFGLTLAGLHLDEQEFQDVWAKVDRDNSNGIDFAEFLEFMCDLKSNLRRITEDDSDDELNDQAAPIGDFSGRREFTFMHNHRGSMMQHAPTGKNLPESVQKQVHSITEATKDELLDVEDTLPAYTELAKPVATPVNQLTPVNSFSSTSTEKQKAFSLGRDMNQAIKNSTPGRGTPGNASDAAGNLGHSNSSAFQDPHSPDTNNQSRSEQSSQKQVQSLQQLQTPATPKDGTRRYPASPPLEKTAIGPDGTSHSYTVSRAQSSFGKVPLGGGNGAGDGEGDDGDAVGPESASATPQRFRSSPNGKSPYAPGSMVKKPVKSLVVSI